MLDRRHTHVGMLAAVCVAALLVSELPAPADASPTSRKVLTQVVCEDAITTMANRLVKPRDVLGGRLRRFSDGVAQRMADDGTPAFPFFRKTRLVVKAGAGPFTIKLAAGWRGRAAMVWGSPRPDAVTDGVRVVPCRRGDDNGDWVVWTGGFLVQEPGCVPLVVTMGDTRYRARVALGLACP
jgi:hypothetical protein